MEHMMDEDDGRIDLLKFVGVSPEKYNYNMNAYNEANLDINFGKYILLPRGLHVKGDPLKYKWGYAAKTAAVGVYSNNEGFFDVNYNDEETPHTKWKFQASIPPKMVNNTSF